MRLPYFWDEAAQFVPAARDILRGAGWIPSSAAPNIHPPGVVAYLALSWRLAGESPFVTRSAMLLLAAFGILSAFLLARELCRKVPGHPEFLAAALLCLSPLFFAQSMLAQLDAPAMLFTTLALWLFLGGRLWLAAAACAALVLVKETGLVVPLVFFLWLAARRRWREAALFVAPAAVLALWIVWLAVRTGHWTGNPEFQRYNLFYPLDPIRIVLAAARRLYYLFFAGFHWIGAAAILYACRKKRLFEAPAWRLAGLIVLAQVLLVTLTGGAVLERYLLPVMPVVYAAMACAISLWPPAPRLAASLALAAGLAAGNWVKPFYPFPHENNLAFTDFVRLHQTAALYLARRYPAATVYTAWPLTLELTRPELGFVPRIVPATPVANFAPATLRSLPWGAIRVFVAFSRDWDPSVNPMHSPPLLHFWERSYQEIASAPRQDLRHLVPLPRVASFTRHGQWVDIYVSPAYGGNATGALRLPTGAYSLRHAGRRRAAQTSGVLPGTPGVL